MTEQWRWIHIKLVPFHPLALTGNNSWLDSAFHNWANILKKKESPSRINTAWQISCDHSLSLCKQPRNRKTTDAFPPRIMSHWSLWAKAVSFLISLFLFLFIIYSFLFVSACCLPVCPQSPIDSVLKHTNRCAFGVWVKKKKKKKKEAKQESQKMCAGVYKHPRRATLVPASPGKKPGRISFNAPETGAK